MVAFVGPHAAHWHHIVRPRQRYLFTCLRNKKWGSEDKAVLFATPPDESGYVEGTAVYPWPEPGPDRPACTFSFSLPSWYCAN